MSRLKQEDGAVLLLTLVIVAVLSALVVEFAFSTRVEMRLAETFRDSTQAYYLARGGVEASRALLEMDNNGYDAANEQWAEPIPGFPVGAGNVSLHTVDLDGRFDLNRLVRVLDADRGTDNPDTVAVERFLRLCDALGLANGPALSEALLDWLDMDDQPGSAGAESAWYLGLDPPYRSRNGSLDSIDELRMVRGFDAETVRALAPHVTVHGSGKLNINSASAEVLHAWAGEDLDLSMAERIVDARQTEPYRTLDDLKRVDGYDATWDSALKGGGDVSVQSEMFLIRSLGEVSDGRRQVQVVARRQDGKTTLLSMKVE